MCYPILLLQLDFVTLLTDFKLVGGIHSFKRHKMYLDTKVFCSLGPRCNTRSKEQHEAHA